MKNKERFKDELIEACKDAEFNKFFDKHIAPAYRCGNNILTEGKKIVLTALWLDEEYQEPEVDWSKIKVDTPILVKNCEDDNWNKRYFAKVVGEKIVTFMDGQTSWTSDGSVIDWKYAKLPEDTEI